jgi:single-stranded-DNA-specific exonuclease
MAPFGVGNPKPLFAIKDAKLSQLRQIGKNKDHLKLTFSSGEHVLDAIAFQMGHYSHEIAKDALLSVLGELSVNEWNGYRKPQMFVKDLSVGEWQLFDWRSERDVVKQAALLPEEKVIVIAFHDETVESFDKNCDGTLAAEKAESLSSSRLAHKYAVFLDVPDRLEHLARLLESESFPERIYAAFKNEASQFFSAIPTREQFKKVYAFLNKYQPVKQALIDRRLSSLVSVSIPNINFIIKVFFDLNFVKIDNGLISVSNHAEKKDLTSSESYITRVKQIETEEILCYSSYSALKRWMNEKSTERTEAKEAARK